MAKTQGMGRQTAAGAPASPADTDTDRRSAAPAAAKPKTYRATAKGYADGRIVEEGEVFTTAAPKGKWMEPVKGSGGGYGVQEAADDAQAPHPDDTNFEGMDEAALQAMAAERGVTQPGELSKKDLITAIKAARRVDAQ